jgi:MFS family permease
MVGKEKMLVAVLIALSVGTLISALATTLPVMLAGRAIQGTGGAVFPLAFGIIRDEFPKDKVATGHRGHVGHPRGGAGGGSSWPARSSSTSPTTGSSGSRWSCRSATVATFLFVPESPVRAPGGSTGSGPCHVGLAGHRACWPSPTGPPGAGPNTTVLGLFGATARADRPLDLGREPLGLAAGRHEDDADPAVWSTNLAALLFGFGMFAMFITVPQFVQTPAHAGYGFGASVTQSGSSWLPFAVAMLIVAPLTGRLAIAIGSKPILVAGSLFAASSYGLLVVAHSRPWNIYVASGLLGIGIALGYASMANLIIEAVPRSQTGVATGMNTNIRNIGAALGSGIATSIIVSSLLKSGFPKEHGYTVSFAVSGAGDTTAISTPREP